MGLHSARAENGWRKAPPVLPLCRLLPKGTGVTPANSYPQAQQFKGKPCLSMACQKAEIYLRFRCPTRSMGGLRLSASQRIIQAGLRPRPLHLREESCGCRYLIGSGLPGFFADVCEVTISWSSSSKSKPRCATKARTAIMTDLRSLVRRRLIAAGKAFCSLVSSGKERLFRFIDIPLSISMKILVSLPVWFHAGKALSHGCIG